MYDILKIITKGESGNAHTYCLGEHSPSAHDSCFRDFPIHRHPLFSYFWLL